MCHVQLGRLSESLRTFKVFCPDIECTCKVCVRAPSAHSRNGNILKEIRGPALESKGACVLRLDRVFARCEFGGLASLLKMPPSRDAASVAESQACWLAFSTMVCVTLRVQAPC